MTEVVWYRCCLTRWRRPPTAEIVDDGTSVQACADKVDKEACAAEMKCEDCAVDTCPICCEEDVEVIGCEEWAGSFQAACTCAACATCIARWVEAAYPECRRNLMIRVQCFGCRKMLPQKLVFKVSDQMLKLADDLDRRERLQCNDLFPEVMQVECRTAECVGIGYLGYETIMCMICEEQWSAVEDEATASNVVHADAVDLTQLASFDKLEKGEMATFKIDSEGKTLVEMRRCPKCKVIVEKNGGCDHSTAARGDPNPLPLYLGWFGFARKPKRDATRILLCAAVTCKLCRHQYYWSTGKAYMV